MADWFEAGLLDLGHKVTFSDTSVESEAINIFWENFLPGVGAQIKATGVRYGIIATEIPDGHAFNWRTEPQWINRYQAFSEVANGADFIWTMVESTVQYYSQFCPTAFVELGFSERLIPPYILTKPEIDFSFFGLKTPYRLKVVDELRKYARVEWPEKFLTAEEVSVLISKTKVGLNFKQSEVWPIPSPTRLGRLMMAKRDVASERTKVATRQGELIGFAPLGQSFSEFALSRLNSDWKDRAENVFENYRALMSMRDIMESALERTVSNIKTQISNRQTISLVVVQPPVLIETYRSWNIVEYSGKYYGLLRGTGDVDVRIGIDRLKKICGMNSVHCADTKVDLLGIILNGGHDRLRFKVKGYIWNAIRRTLLKH